MTNNLDLYFNGISEVIKVNQFSELKNSSILVTGANGLIGSAIIDVLNYLNVNYDYNISIKGSVRNLNKLPERFKDYSNLEIIEYDVTNMLEYDGKIDYIINTASNANPIKFSTDPVGTITSNFIGTKNLLDYCVTNKVKKFLEISSGEIYGQGSEDIESFKEDYMGYINLADARSCYPVGKIAAENLCISYARQYNILVTIARLCHTYGPTQNDSDSRVSAQFIRNVLSGNDIIMKSEGLQVRSYCYVLDAVTGILKILAVGENCNAYNVANKDSVLSIREMAEIIAKKSDHKVIFENADNIEKFGYNRVTRSVLDGEKLESIGWKPIYTFDKGIEETINVLKK